MVPLLYQNSYLYQTSPQLGEHPARHLHGQGLDQRGVLDRQHGHPTTPIILAEGTPYPGQWMNGPPFPDQPKDDALRAAYESLVSSGDKHLHYVHSSDLFKSPLVNPTVAGTHSSDLGQYEIADFYVKTLPGILQL